MNGYVLASFTFHKLKSCIRNLLKLALWGVRKNENVSRSDVANKISILTTSPNQKRDTWYATGVYTTAVGINSTYHVHIGHTKSYQIKVRSRGEEKKSLFGKT